MQVGPVATTTNHPLIYFSFRSFLVNVGLTTSDTKYMYHIYFVLVNHMSLIYDSFSQFLVDVRLTIHIFQHMRILKNTHLSIAHNT